MEYYFQRCNSCYVLKGDNFELGNSHDVLKNQKKYINSGFIPDVDNDLYFRPGYGALMFFCGNCDTLESFKNDSNYYYSYLAIMNRINEGYNVVIGPGIMGGYAVYCSNYQEILEKINGKKSK